ncbi:MAG: FAD-binding oxidoreductase [Gemmatimonadota bacterium]|nr:FAD-binding oxidoreductase [Gemmatimonadota bacterium]
MTGRPLCPGDAGYDEASAVWNARFESRPEEIVRAEAAEDVSRALRRAVERDLDVTVKGGGHDYAGNSACRGGLLIDLSPLDAVVVDAERRRVTVGAGARWGDVDAATQAHGLATPGGTVSTVGVAGFTLGGGQGWLARKHGLACDNLLAAEMVTASGETVRASETENPDLFWALRGGGGNFGVVTSFELALHELEHDVLAGQVVYPFDRAGELLRFYRDVFEDAPDEMACFPFIYRVPPLDVFPASVHGDIVLAFVVAWMGPAAEGESRLAPFRERGDPILDGVFPQSYLDLQRSFDEQMAPGSRWYTRAHELSRLTDDAIDAILEAVPPLPGDFTSVYLGPMDGAVGRVGPEETAYPHRDSAHGIHIFPGWIDPDRDDEIMDWARRVSNHVAPHADEGVYVNLLGEDEGPRVRAAYGPNYERLGRIKAAWDPDNLFRANHNVPPRA